MSNFKGEPPISHDNPHHFNYLVGIVLAVIVAGSIFFVISFNATGESSGLFQQRICFENSCLERFYKTFKYTLQIPVITGSAVALLITFGGVLIALQSYLATKRASALSNHLSHISIFTNYLYTEIDKRDLLSRGSFDVLQWYNLIYKNSRNGDLSISREYKEAIRAINSVILHSNSLVSKVKPGEFRYKPHQESMINALSALGIKLTFTPRLAFYDIEGQIFDIIDIVNKSFCLPSEPLEIKDRTYR